jgi:hypothetical protein
MNLRTMVVVAMACATSACGRGTPEKSPTFSNVVANLSTSEPKEGAIDDSRWASPE